MTRLAIVLSLSVFAAACYGSAPPRAPTIPLPALSDEAVISVHSETTTKIEQVPKEEWTCPAGHAQGDPACLVTRYTAAEPVTTTKTRATYGSEPISVAQFKVLTDPDYARKVSRLDDLRHKCTRANVPRYAGMGLVIGGLVGMIVSRNSGIPGLVSWGAIGAGGVSYGVGYFAYGGRDCNRASDLYRQLDLREQQEWAEAYGEDNAADWKVLAERFNQRGTAPGEHLTLSE